MLLSPRLIHRVYLLPIHTEVVQLQSELQSAGRFLSIDQICSNAHTHLLLGMRACHDAVELVLFVPSPILDSRPQGRVDFLSPILHIVSTLDW